MNPVTKKTDFLLITHDFIKCFAPHVWVNTMYKINYYNIFSIYGNI